MEGVNFDNNRSDYAMMLAKIIHIAVATAI
jgi:hypothetical protein